MKQPPLATIVHVPATSLAPTAAQLAQRESDRNEAKALVDDSTSANTRRAYAFDWVKFETWCTANGACALPADDDTVSRYLVHLFKVPNERTGKPNATKSIERALAGIAFKHRECGFEWEISLFIRKELKSIRKRRAEAGMHAKKMAPLSKDTLLDIVHKLGDSLRDVRDRAIISMLWVGVFRRSEVAHLDVGDIKFVPRQGLLVRPKTSKTDQLGEDEGKALPLMTDLEGCPTHTLRTWLDRAKITDGPLFRRILPDGSLGKTRLTGHAIAKIVKRLVRLVELNPEEYSGHSARAGAMTSLAEDGKELSAIMSQSGHKNEAVARGYVRHGTKFTKNVMKGAF